jgi:hypothetical protein
MELPFPQKRTLGVVLRTGERIHSSLRLQKRAQGKDEESIPYLQDGD